MGWSFQEQKLPHPILTFLSQVVVQSPSCVWLFVTGACQTSLSLTISQSLPKFMTIASVMSFQSSHPLLLLPSIFPSIRVFSNESAHHMAKVLERQSFQRLMSKYWSISLSKEHSWLITFKIDWFDLLAFQGTLKSLLQHHSSKASIL